MADADNSKLISTKRVKIDKANTTIVLVTSISSFILVFCIFASKAMIGQYAYQARVISAQENTVNTLISNQNNATQLINSYNTFNSQSVNIIGGSEYGTSSNQDGSNGKIILDALPNKYDFPALVTAVQNLLSTNGVTITSIGGSDTSSTPTPAAAPTTATAPASSATTTAVGAPIAIPFTFSISGTYANDNVVLSRLQNSIRPIQVTTIQITGSDSQATIEVNAESYYMPTSGLVVSTENIK